MFVILQDMLKQRRFKTDGDIEDAEVLWHEKNILNEPEDSLIEFGRKPKVPSKSTVYPITESYSSNGEIEE